MAKLTERQQKFADKYIETMNATQSAIQAGYSEKTAYSQGQRQLKNVEVLNYINKALEPGRNQRIVTRDEALELMSSLARGETKDSVTLFVGEGVQDIVEIPTPTNVRKQAIEALLKRFDMADKDRIELEKLKLEVKKLEKELQTETSTEDKLAELIKQNREVLGHDKD